MPPPAVAATPGDFYFNRAGKKVPLKRDAALYSVRFVRGRSVDDANVSTESRNFLKTRSVHQRFLSHYNLQVYEARDGATTDQHRASVRSLNDEAEIEFAAPVFRRSARATDVVYLLNRFVIEFEDGVSEAAAQSFLAGLNSQTGARIAQKLGYTAPRAGYLIETASGDGPNGPIELAKRYYETGNAGGAKLVLYAIPDLVQPREFRAAVAPVVRDELTWTYRTEQWHLQNAKVIPAWSVTEGDPSILIGIADDGLDTAHPEFAGRVVEQFDFATNLPGDARPKNPIDNHGTACAGVAAAGGVAARGVAPKCRLIAARTPDYLGVQDEAAMFQWLADRGAHVITCSWGPPDGTGAAYPLPDNVASAMNYCVTAGRAGKGIPIVWAAGNGSESVSPDGYSSNPYVIAVAACTDQDTHAYYSDFGPEIFITAPSSGRTSAGNRRVFTTDRSGADGYNLADGAGGDAGGLYTNDFGGTSSAAPLIAGVIGLMLSANPALTLAQVKDILKSTADKIVGGYDANGHNDQFGFGRVNAEKAVAEAKRLNNGGTNTGTTPNSGTTPQPPAQTPNGINVTVTAPARVYRGSPPFQIQFPAGRFYAVEAAVRQDLFTASVRGPNPNPAEFYATWQDSPLFLDQAVYRLPSEVWSRLSLAPRIFYRLWTSARRDSWSDARATQIFSIEIIS